MTLDDKVIISDSVFAQKIDEEVVILDTVKEEYFGLDEMAAVIWQHLNASGSLRETYDSMLEAYEVDAEQLEADICRFVQELVDTGLVEVAA